MISLLESNKSWVVFVSTFPPRECGIATFTQDLANAFDRLYFPQEETRVVALNVDEYSRHKYPAKVIFQFPQTTRTAYREIASQVNKQRQVKFVSVQHEFGIFGGDYGSYLLDFLAEIKKPVAVTFHSVLPTPEEKMRAVVEQIARQSSFVVVMTESARDILVGRYGIPAEKVKVIHHGIHPRPYRESLEAKTTTGIPNRFILSSFGLLGRSKGLEYALDALPPVVKIYPDVLYLIIGATHPAVLKQEGESYRNFLVQKINDLHLENNVIFYNQYLKTNNLLDFLQATDIYLSLSQDPDQAVSGTLSYALGAGRPVISTSFAHAQEIVTAEVGRLVGFGNSAEITKAILDLMSDREKLKVMGETAYFRTRKMTWPNVALSYMREIIAAVPAFKEKESNLPAIKIKHLANLTDVFGIFQFAVKTTRDPVYGYTTDDNARALMAMVKIFAKTPKAQVARLISTYLGFLEYVADNREGFANFVNHDKSFYTEKNERENLADANARAFYALAFVAARPGLPEEFKQRAERLFQSKFNPDKKIVSPRAAAFTILALSEWLTTENNNKYGLKIRELANYLVGLFEGSRGESWDWFEDILAYSNGVLPESLLVAYEKTNNDEYLRVARTSLDFLIKSSFDDNVCAPVGQDIWYRRGGVKSLNDQQPEEVATLVSVLARAYLLTKERKYQEKMGRAFDWFLGNNHLEQVVYDESTGGSYDGVGETHINLNQGAESTIMYLLARLTMEEMRGK